MLANFALFNAIWIGMVFKIVFFGQLRAIEYEVCLIRPGRNTHVDGNSICSRDCGRS